MGRRVKIREHLKATKNIPSASTNGNKYAVHPVQIVNQLTFKDERHKNAMCNLVNRKTGNPEGSLLEVMGGRDYVKQAYRLLDNDNIDYNALLDEVTSFTKRSMSGLGRVIVAQDTTYVNLAGHVKTQGLGYQSEKTLGLLVHSAIALTSEGETIGLLHQLVTTRLKEEGTIFSLDDEGNLKAPKESIRWLDTFQSIKSNLPEGVKPVMVCDRESDIYEMFVEGVNSKADFIFRIAQNRKTDEAINLKDKILSQKPIGVITIEKPHNSRTGEPNRKMEIEIQVCEITILAPKNRKTNTEQKSITINVVAATELNPTDKKNPAQWILGTNLPIASESHIKDIIKYYTLRWRIETFHYTLKSGLKIEKIQQRKFSSYKPLINISSIIACYIMQITHSARTNPNLSCDHYFCEMDWKTLYRVATKNKKSPKKPYTIKEAVDYLTIISKGKRYKSDGPPGVKTIWTGLRNLTIIVDALENLNLMNHI